MPRITDKLNKGLLHVLIICLIDFNYLVFEDHLSVKSHLNKIRHFYVKIHILFVGFEIVTRQYIPRFFGSSLRLILFIKFYGNNKVLLFSYIYNIKQLYRTHYGFQIILTPINLHNNNTQNIMLFIVYITSLVFIRISFFKLIKFCACFIIFWLDKNKLKFYF